MQSTAALSSCDDHVLTIDLGTTLYKIARFDSQGVMLDLERVAPPVERPQTNRMELDTEKFKTAIVTAVAKLKSRAGAGWHRIAAISFATQANSFTLLNEQNQPLIPLILWPDQRASELGAELNKISNLVAFRQTTGMPKFGPLLGLAKLLWLCRHQPELIPRIRRFCYISDYLTLWMTGHHLTEAGVAGLSGALDIRRLNWWEPAFKQLQIPVEWMPEIIRTGTDLCPIVPVAADALGLSHNCRFIVGCLDQYAGAIGTGTVKPDRICETTGTVLAAVRCTDRLADNPASDVYQGPAFRDGLHYQMSFSSTSANLLEHYRNQHAPNLSFDELTRLAIEAPPTDLQIEPYNDAGSIASSFRNIKPDHTPGQITRAIMQRVAQSLKAQIRSLTNDQMPTEIRSAGGGARNDFWLQLKARELKTNFTAIAADEPTSLGAAMLAVSAIRHEDLQTLAPRFVKTRATFSP